MRRCLFVAQEMLEVPRVASILKRPTAVCVCVLAPLEGGGGGELKMEIFDCFVGWDFGRSIESLVVLHPHAYTSIYIRDLYLRVRIYY